MDKSEYIYKTIELGFIYLGVWFGITAQQHSISDRYHDLKRCMCLLFDDFLFLFIYIFYRFRFEVTKML